LAVAHQVVAVGSGVDVGFNGVCPVLVCSGVGWVCCGCVTCVVVASLAVVGFE